MLPLGCLQVSRLVQMQKETLADERAIVLGEHKAELKTLVSVMSASINRDLPVRIEEMVGRAVRLHPFPLTLCLQSPIGAVSGSFGAFGVQLKVNHSAGLLRFRGPSRNQSMLLHWADLSSSIIYVTYPKGQRSQIVGSGL